MLAASVEAYQFGSFILNLERGCLQQGGVDLELRPKAFDVLKYLVERAGKLVSKDELVEAVWPNVTVSDDSLAQCIRDIRKRLEDHHQRFIKTVPRRGYIFVDEVTALDVARDTTPLQPPATSKSIVRSRWAPIAAAVAITVAGLAAAGFAASRQSPRAVSEIVPISAAKETSIGQVLAYPDGVPLVTAELVIMPPGESSPWHLHKVPSFVYVLEGEVSVDYGAKGTRTYAAGQSMLEATDWPHAGYNPGRVPARLLVVFMGAEGIETRTASPAPVASATGHDQAH